MRLGTQLVPDNRRERGEPGRQCSKQPEASGEHHVAVRHREMRTEPRAVEQTATRPGNRQPFRRRCIDTELQRPVAHVGEHLVVVLLRLVVRGGNEYGAFLDDPPTWAARHFSAELDEVLALSDTIGVIYKGKLVATMPRAQATREQLGLLIGIFRYG